MPDQIGEIGMTVLTSSIVMRGGRGAYLHHRLQHHGDLTVCGAAVDGNWREGLVGGVSRNPEVWCRHCFPRRFTVVHGTQVSLSHSGSSVHPQPEEQQ